MVGGGAGRVLGAGDRAAGARVREAAEGDPRPARGREAAELVARGEAQHRRQLLPCGRRGTGHRHRPGRHGRPSGDEPRRTGAPGQPGSARAARALRGRERHRAVHADDSGLRRCLPRGRTGRPTRHLHRRQLLAGRGPAAARDRWRAGDRDRGPLRARREDDRPLRQGPRGRGAAGDRDSCRRRGATGAKGRGPLLGRVPERGRFPRFRHRRSIHDH